jgi:hypothetical protein
MLPAQGLHLGNGLSKPQNCQLRRLGVGNENVKKFTFSTIETFNWQTAICIHTTCEQTAAKAQETTC